MRRFRRWLKKHFSLDVDRAAEGAASLVVLTFLILAVGSLSGCAASPTEKRRFADAITHDPDLPVGRPITVSDAAKSGEAAELRALSI